MIEKDSDIELVTYLNTNKALIVSEIVDQNGKTLLHECTFNDSMKCLKALISLGNEQLANPQELATWINQRSFHGLITPD